MSFFRASSPARFRTAWLMSVAMKPGATAFTRTFRAANSAASTLVKLFTAPLLAA